MRKFRLPIALAVALAGALASAAVSLPATAEEVGAPSARLIAATSDVTLYATERNRVALDLPVWLSAVGGDLEFHVRRADYESPPVAIQVDSATGSALRQLPAETLRQWLGFRRFIRVTFMDPQGVIVADRGFTTCINGWNRQRMNDEGAVTSRYPQGCFAGSLFQRGMIWGIDEHWAVRALSSDYSSPRVRVPPGNYIVTVEIAEPFVDLLGVAPEDARVTLDARVERSSSRNAPPPRISLAGDRGGSADSAPDGAPVETVTAPDPSTLPDIAALPAFFVGSFSRRDRDFIRFSATIWNGGPAPMVVEGFRRAGTDTMDAYQYFYDRSGNVTGRAPVGTFEYDPKPGHRHWHLDQFARYTLVDLETQEIVRSKKQSFCLVHTDLIDLTVPGAVWTQGPDDLHSVCGEPGSMWVRETLGAGWGDTYHQGLPGQALDITGVPNGSYYIEVKADPLEVLYDVNADNDVERRLIRLGGKPGAHTVTVSPWHGIQD